MTDSPGQTWYVVLPFATEESARSALHQIETTPGYLGMVRSAAGDDPSECDPEYGEAQRIAGVYQDGSAELARIEAEDARHD